MKKWWTAASFLLTLCVGAGAVFGLYKVNHKVNILAGALQEQNNRSASDIRLSYIPDLDPGTEGWKVTQFGDVGGEQEMCYTITTATGLVIVDGGQSYEAPRLREIIARYGNCVEAWILTHPHSDHISAFMDIYDDPRGIEIHHIYTAQFPDEELMKENAPWDNYEALERFLGMDIPLEYVKEGDTLNLLGLEVEILSAYSDKVDELSNDLMNDGSVMFRIRGTQDSMLFCADVGKSLTDDLVDTYGGDLRSDYVQMGHHGFGGPGAEFYELVDPRGAFFDAPAWLMEDDTDRSTREKEKLIRDMGRAVYSYYTAPNQILLR